MKRVTKLSWRDGDACAACIAAERRAVEEHIHLGEDGVARRRAIYTGVALGALGEFGHIRRRHRARLHARSNPPYSTAFSRFHTLRIGNDDNRELRCAPRAL